MKVLVTGGAGYVGSFAVRDLAASGVDIVVYDSLEHGHRAAIGDLPLVVADLADGAALDAVFAAHRFDAVLHFAGYIEAGESVRYPDRFMRNNVVNSLSLLEAMLAHDVRRIVFSSSAAVYGEPTRLPIAEDDPKRPINPYALGKYVVEETLAAFDVAYGVKSVSLRYFNAAGGELDGSLGEDHPNESHLIPLVLQVPLGKRPEILVFGDDYDTPDGTCVRDYIHVKDLAAAHVLALRALAEGGGSVAYNVGSGVGYSVREVIAACRRVSGHPIAARVAPRRSGDAARLWADSSKLQRELGWRPLYSDLETIVETAWRWHRSHPDGFASAIERRTMA